jgi:protein-disulfide isomerase
MYKKIIIVSLSGTLAGILFLVGKYFYQKSEAQRIGAIAGQNYSVFVREHSPRLGNVNAKVVLVEYLDPECESCREFYPLVKSLLTDYGDKLQLVIRYAPFHANSKIAIKILEAAKLQNKYWETLEVLFRYQPIWGDHHHPRPDLIWKYLPESGVNVEQVRLDMNDPRIDKIIEQDVADMKELRVSGTPTFFVNSKPLERFSYSHLKEMIERELTEN